MLLTSTHPGSEKFHSKDGKLCPNKFRGHNENKLPRIERLVERCCNRLVPRVSYLPTVETRLFNWNKTQTCTAVTNICLNCITEVIQATQKVTFFLDFFTTFSYRFVILSLRKCREFWVECSLTSIVSWDSISVQRMVNCRCKEDGAPVG